jgi:hypothetical protein
MYCTLPICYGMPQLPTIVPITHRLLIGCLRAYQLPDVNPRNLPETCNFSMCAGDFVEVYRSQTNHWHCIVTCFFIDTAHNIIEYVDVIHNALVPGGYWLNLGMLLLRCSGGGGLLHSVHVR